MQKRGSKFLSKRGTLTLEKILTHLGMLGLAILVYFILQSYVKSIDEDTEFQKIFLTRDTSLLVSTLYAAPGRVDYIYAFDKLELGKFKFEFGALSAMGNTPVVWVERDGLAKNYPYGKPRNSNEQYLISGAKSIKFSKTDKKITINKNE